MKTVDKKEVLSSQSAQFIQEGEEGKFLKLISDTFIIKMENGAQGYAIRHINMTDMILIDTVGKGAQKAIKHLVEEGYKIKAILITHKEALKNAYADLRTISDDAGKAPVYTHPMNTDGENITLKNILEKNTIFEHFSIAVRDFPARSGEAAVIYSEINNGMIFCGNTAAGSSYDDKDEDFKRPDLGKENKNFSLAENWSSVMWEFRYFFPYKGKPGFNLEEGKQKDIIIKLGNSGRPDAVNPNL